MDELLNVCPVRNRALVQANDIAIKNDQRRITFKQLDQLINSLSIQFASKKIAQGDRLVCIVPNSLNLVLLQLTCLRNGVIFCPINSAFSENEILSRLTILDSPFLYLANTDFQASSLTFDFNRLQQGEEKAVQINPQQVCNIIFTSGSSGQPKAVMHNFSNHYYSASGSQAIIPLKKGDNNLLSLPIFHISGYATVIRTLLAGATLFLTTQKLNIKQLESEKITHLSLVAKQLYSLLDEQMFTQKNLSIQHLLLGGSAFSEALLQQTQERGFNYHLSYGLTEMSSQVATSSNNQRLTLLENRELKIVNDEIFLRGKTRFVGYFNKQNKIDITSTEQWFASKDLGTKKGDQITIIGRKDRQFISGGENIQPEEIEKTLLTFETVKQAFVVPVNDKTFGFRPVAFIDWLDNKAEVEKLKAYMASNLIHFKCPTSYFELAPQKGLKVSLKNLQNMAENNLPNEG